MSKLVGRISEGRGRVLIAVDDPSLSLKDFESLVLRTKELVAGYKVGVPYLLSFGLDSIRDIIRRYEDTYFIADLKLADVDVVMSLTARVARAGGFDGVIAHGFVGREGGLEGLHKVCMDLNMDLYVLVSMSHPGSLEIYDLVMDKVLALVEVLKPTGVVAPATRSNVIKYVRQRLGRHYIIISPGVGVQGAEFGSALCAGADFEIVGRAITKSEDVVRATEHVIKAQEDYVRSRKCVGD